MEEGGEMISSRSAVELAQMPSMHGVLDASVASRWFIPTQASARSHEVLEAVLATRGGPTGHGFVVPEAFYPEVLSAVSKQSRDQAALSHCQQTLHRLPVERVAWAHVPASRCVELIVRRVGAYDSIYAAIAMERGLPLVTSDARLARALGEPTWVVLVD